MGAWQLRFSPFSRGSMRFGHATKCPPTAPERQALARVAKRRPARMPDGTYVSDGHVKLEHGDLMLAFTDGLVEAPEKDDHESLYGEERLRQSFAELCAEGASTEVIAKKLAESALSFSGGAHDDDITLVVLRRT